MLATRRLTRWFLLQVRFSILLRHLPVLGMEDPASIYNGLLGLQISDGDTTSS